MTTHHRPVQVRLPCPLSYVSATSRPTNLVMELHARRVLSCLAIRQKLSAIKFSADQASAINAPLLLPYAGLDERVIAGIATYEAALKRNGKRYMIHMYPSVNHAFNNETEGCATIRGKLPTWLGIGR